ncbi:MAG TPA: type II toxin-antitoxin system RelE/ParE family toxin [Armatimonadota bacterium]|jgi:hypothetical protein
MPRIDVIYFMDDTGFVPLLAWMDKQTPAVQNKGLERIERLTENGHELRRPHADTLTGGLHELRFKSDSSQVRILYFFHGRTIAVLTGGLKKNCEKVPQAEINHALDLKRRFEACPEHHTYKEEP